MPLVAGPSAKVDAVTAMAARVVRDLLIGSQGADVCAGVREFDLNELDRITDSVIALARRLELVRTRARMSRQFGAFYAYTFDVVTLGGDVVSAITVRTRGASHAERLRSVAANLLIENTELYGEGVRLSHEAPRITPSPE